MDVFKIKECTKCGETKELSEFYSQKKKKANGDEYTYYRPDCIVCSKVNATNWQQENPDKLSKLRKNRNNKDNYRAYVKKNREKMKEINYYQNYYYNNKDKHKQYVIDHESKKHEVTKTEWEFCKEYFDYSCAYCGISEAEAKKNQGNNLHKEHPYNEGDNDITNCIPACKSCNSTKWKRDFEEWYTTDNPVYSEERLYKILEWLHDTFKEQIAE